MDRHDFYVDYLNRILLSKTYEEEGFFKAGVVWGLRFEKLSHMEIERQLTKLELFANGVARKRSIIQNQKIVKDFLEMK